MVESGNKSQEKIKLVEINSHLTCFLCKGYYIDATTISECLHSFCRSCIIRFLHENSYCPICEVIINKAKPNLKLDKTLQDIVYKLVPELFYNEMKRRQRFYRDHPDLTTKVTPEERGEDTERTIFNPSDTISLSIEYIGDDSTPGAIIIPHLHDKGTHNNKTNADNDDNSAIRRFLQCSGMCRVEVLKKFIGNKYNVDTNQYYIDILYKRVPLPDHYTLIDIAYIYSWKRNEPLKFFFKITDINFVNDNFDYLIQPQINYDLKQDNVKKDTPRTTNVVDQIKSKSKECTTEKKPLRKSPEIKNQNQKSRNPPKEKEYEIERYPSIKFDSTDNGESPKLRQKGNKIEWYSSITLNSTSNDESSKLKQKENKIDRYSSITLNNIDNDKSSKLKEKDHKSDHNPLDDADEGKPPKLKEKEREFDQCPIITRNNADDGNPPKLKGKVDKIDQSSITTTLNDTNNSNTPKLKEKKHKIERQNITLNDTGNRDPSKFKEKKQKIDRRLSTTNLNDTTKGDPPKLKEKKHKIDKYPNLTLDDTDDVNIIKIEKVSNRNGLQIGIKITKQTPKNKPVISKPENPKNLTDIETAKSNFFKSIELTAKNNVTHTSSAKNNVTNTVPPKCSPPKTLSPKCSPPKTLPPKKELTPKRKSQLSSKIEKSRKSKKLGNPQTPTAAQLQDNVKKDTPKTNILDQIKSNSDLQALLYDSYKINIPSSLSVTVKESDEPTSSPFQKPVQNYIEILKIPDTSTSTIPINTKSPTPTKTKEDTSEVVKSKLELNPIINTEKTEPSKQEIETTTKPPSKTPTSLPSPTYLPCKVTNMPSREAFIKLYPRTPQSFQKMFEETIKTPDFNSKFQTLAVTRPEVPSPSSPTQKTSLAETPTTAKRKILEIASRLYKKTKMEQEKNAVTAKLPRSNHTKKVKNNPPLKDFNSYISSKPVQTTSLHSPSLGLNYTVSVSQTVPSSNLDSNVGSTSSPVEPAKISQPPPQQVLSKPSSTTPPAPPSSRKKTSPSPTASKINLNAVTNAQSENNQPLDTDKLLEKYKIPNMAQLSASLNFPANLCMNASASQLAAIHQAMIYKHFEIQNRQNWLNMNSGPLMQYENYLKSLSKS